MRFVTDRDCVDNKLIFFDGGFFGWANKASKALRSFSLIRRLLTERRATPGSNDNGVILLMACVHGAILMIAIPPAAIDGANKTMLCTRLTWTKQ